MEDNSEKQRLRREWRDKILLNGVKCLHRASEGMFGSAAMREQEQVAGLAVQLARLRGDTEPGNHVRDAARLLITEARQAIWYEREERPRLEKERRSKEYDAMLQEKLSDPHPYIDGGKVHPDMSVDFAYVFSDGAPDLPAPPAKLRSGKKPPVPLRKSKTALIKLLQRVAQSDIQGARRARGEANAVISEAELKGCFEAWLGFEKRGSLPLYRYEQILWHVDAAERERTANARQARNPRVAEKLVPANLVKKRRSRK